MDDQVIPVPPWKHATTSPGLSNPSFSPTASWKGRFTELIAAV